MQVPQTRIEREEYIHMWSALDAALIHPRSYRIRFPLHKPAPPRRICMYSACTSGSESNRVLFKTPLCFEQCITFVFLFWAPACQRRRGKETSLLVEKAIFRGSLNARCKQQIFQSLVLTPKGTEQLPRHWSRLFCWKSNIASTFVIWCTDASPHPPSENTWDFSVKKKYLMLF